MMGAVRNSDAEKATDSTRSGGLSTCGESGYQAYLEDLGERVERHIAELLPPELAADDMLRYAGEPTWEYDAAACSAMLSRPVWDLIRRRGKRWRAAFGVLLLEVLGRDPAPYEALVSVLAELIHTGLLIVDDVEDGSLLRRGDECIHLRYGQDVAINAANAIYFLPITMIASHPSLSDAQKLEAYRIISEQFVRGHFGQALDLYWSRNMDDNHLDEWLSDSLGPKILQMYDLKTAAPIEGLARIAAVLAEVGDDARDSCVAFARTFGVAFQIVDDIHNFSDSPKWRKQCGEDLAEGKLTYVMYRAIGMLPSAESGRLRQILGSDEERCDETALGEGIELIRSSGSLNECRREAQTMFSRSWDTFTREIPASGPKAMLHALCGGLIDLDLSS